MKPSRYATPAAAALALRQVQVRPIRPSERARWERLMAQHHYLGWPGAVGESLQYVATIRGRWVALLAFGAVAYCLHDREGWIGWSTEQRRRRLNFLTQNRRFLILPGVPLANLASRVLGLCVRRLARDWEAKYRHPVWLVETFVDPQRFEGTCYRAAGWERLGQSAGCRRATRDFYVADQHPKELWIKPLRRDARALLRAADWPARWQAHEQRIPPPSPVRTEASRSLWAAFATVPEFRHKRGQRHPLAAVLGCAACAVLAGADNIAVMAEIVAGLEQRQLRALRCWRNPHTGRHEPPSETTLRRVLAGVDAEQFDTIVAHWVAAQEPTEAIALDGKALKGCLDEEGRPLFLVSAVAHGSGALQGQVAVPAKTNEIVGARDLVRQLGPLDEVLVTADAAHTQVETARLIVQDHGGDYLLPLKANQPTLLAVAEQLLPRDAFSPSGERGGEKPRSAGNP